MLRESLVCHHHLRQSQSTSVHLSKRSRSSHSLENHSMHPVCWHHDDPVRSCCCWVGDGRVRWNQPPSLSVLHQWAHKDGGGSGNRFVCWFYVACFWESLTTLPKLAWNSRSSCLGFWAHVNLNMRHWACWLGKLLWSLYPCNLGKGPASDWLFAPQHFRNC